MIVPTAGTSPFTRKTFAAAPSWNRLRLASMPPRSRVLSAKSFARKPDRGLQARLQRQLAVLLRQMRPARRFAWNAGSERRRGGAARHDVALLIQEHVARRRLRRDFARVDHGLESIRRAMQQPESAAAESRAARLDDRERRAHGDCCVESIAALLQDLQSRLSRQLMRARDRRLRRFRRRVRSGEPRREQRDDEQEMNTRAEQCELHVGLDLGLQALRRAQARCRAASTAGCTNSLTLPPKLAISRTSEDEMKVKRSAGVRNT